MIKKVFIFVLVLFALFHNTAYLLGNETNDPSSLSFDEKMYVTSEQLVCSDHGIFVLIENSNGDLLKILVPQVNWDTKGLFVLVDHLPLPYADWCPRGHKACSRCGRCDVQGCPAYGCKCRRR